jgi:glycosyltransferase involved in cell wall biosynthesis
VYNGGNYLREAIESALAQTYGNLEVIIVNDGSNDGGETESIANSYGDRIHYFSKPNGGVSTALNLGIREMKGDYFSWLSHDDIYLPSKIEEQISCLARQERDVIIYTDNIIINKYSQQISIKKLKSLSSRKLRYSLISSQPFHGCSLLIPKKFLCDAGMFNENLRTTQDYDLWLKLAEHYEFVHLPKVLIGVRSHPERGIWAQRPLWLRECNEFYSYHLTRLYFEWDKEHTVESMAIFSIKSLIKMERFGLKDPAMMCRRAFIKSWCDAKTLSNISFYYWSCYYAIFRIKRFIIR